MTSTSSNFTSPSLPLKRLGPVRENGSFYYTKSSEIASNVYGYLKQYAPKGALPHIAQLEDTVSSYSYPALAKIQDRSDSILKSLDGQVDYVAKQAGGYYGSASDTVSSTHKDNMQRFHSSRQTYFSKIHETVEYVKQHGLVGSARATADTLMGQVKEAQKATEKQAGYATEKVKETWSSFLNLPLVQKILSDSSNATSFAWSKYMTTHDAVLGHPTYHKAYKGSMDTVSSISSTPLYQKAKSDLYPTVAPYVDPALEKISHNSYYKAGVDHLKPVQSNGKLS